MPVIIFLIYLIIDFSPFISVKIKKSTKRNIDHLRFCKQLEVIYAYV